MTAELQPRTRQPLVLATVEQQLRQNTRLMLLPPTAVTSTVLSGSWMHERVMATLADMRAAHNDWGIEKTQDIETAMEQLKAAQNSFLQAKAALEQSLNTAEVVTADAGVGQRESLTNV